MPYTPLQFLPNGWGFAPPVPCTVSRVGGPHTSTCVCPCCEREHYDCIDCAGCCWSTILGIKITAEYDDLTEAMITVSGPGGLTAADVRGWWISDSDSPKLKSGVVQDFAHVSVDCNETGGTIATFNNNDGGGAVCDYRQGTISDPGWWAEATGGLGMSTISPWYVWGGSQIHVPGNCCGLARTRLDDASGGGFKWAGSVVGLNGHYGDWVARIPGYFTVEVYNNNCCREDGSCIAGVGDCDGDCIVVLP